jgi:predicted AlkP superfamily phosphohydrolase/phosphomutase
LNCQEGIKGVILEDNYDNYIFKVSLHFDNVESLLNAFKETMKASGNAAEEYVSNDNWVSWDGVTLIRQIPDLSSFKFRLVKNEDQELMRNGMYTSISRFDSPVEKIENTSAILAKNNKAVMLRSSLLDVFGNPSIMDNTISVKPADN